MTLPRSTGPAGRSAWDRLGAIGPHVVDAGLLLGVGMLVLLDALLVQDRDPRGALGQLALSATSLVAVASRRRWPVASMLAMVLVVLATAAGGGVEGGWRSPFPLFAPVAALAALATPVVRRSGALVATAASLAGAVAVAGLVLGPDYREEVALLLGVLLPGTYVIGVGAGVYLRDLDRRQRLAADAARHDERLDLARELHDLVAHYVTAIVVQAQAARVVADRDPQAAGSALEQIEGAGKDALAAMRRMVGSLRNEGGGVAPGGGPGGVPTAPPIGLAGLDDLVSGAHRLGFVVHLDLDEEARALVPGAVAASVHRIVQESLTNVRRHGVGVTRADVQVRLGPGSLVVTVTDDGVPVVAGRAASGGYGVVGMAERAHALGGTLTAGPVPPPGHGWRVQARLPLDVPAGTPR